MTQVFFFEKNSQRKTWFLFRCEKFITKSTVMRTLFKFSSFLVRPNRFINGNDSVKYLNRKILFFAIWFLSETRKKIALREKCCWPFLGKRGGWGTFLFLFLRRNLVLCVLELSFLCLRQAVMNGDVVFNRYGTYFGAVLLFHHFTLLFRYF